MNVRLRVSACIAAELPGQPGAAVPTQSVVSDQGCTGVPQTLLSEALDFDVGASVPLVLVRHVGRCKRERPARVTLHICVVKLLKHNPPCRICV